MPQNLADSGQNIAHRKSVLRDTFRCRRSDVSKSERVRQEQETIAALDDYSRLTNANRVGLYASFGDEFPTETLARLLESRGQHVVYPRCIPKMRLEFAPASLPTKSDGWTVSKFGVPEPSGVAVDPETIDVLIVPVLAIDRDGTRLGWGAGYYDRLLAAVPTLQPRTVGLAFSEQISASRLPRDAFDIPLSLLAHAGGIVTTHTSLTTRIDSHP